MSARATAIGALLLALLLAGAAGLTRPENKSPTETTELHAAVSEKFTFVPAQLACKAGARVRLRITHQVPAGGPDIPHSTVLLRRGVNLEDFGRAVLSARQEDNFVPDGYRRQVIASSPIVHAGGQVEMNFQAPTEPGEYPLVCSFPGHCLLGMRATLLVE